MWLDLRNCTGEGAWPPIAPVQFVFVLAPGPELNHCKPPRSFVLRLQGSQRAFHVPTHESALSVLLDNDVEVPYQCTQGHCGSCVTRVTSGIPEHRDTVLSEGMRRSNEFIALCVSRAETPELVVDL